MKTILVTGGNGQLGNAIQVLAKDYAQYTFLFTDVNTLDICDKEAVLSYVKSHSVDFILNCAAYTAVDKAEDDLELCTRINRDAVKNLSEAALTVGAKIIHISTDYVFNGTNYLPYIETDQPSPVSAYGRTKLEGELALQTTCEAYAIIRTAWLYSEFGNNFVKTMLRLGSERGELNVIFDQIGTPTYALDLAKAMLAMVDSAETDSFMPGVYHFSNEGVCSWYDFAVEIFKLADINCKVSPIETKDYPTRAIRPHYSVLNKGKIKQTYKISIPHWEESLSLCIQKLTVK